MSSNDSSEHSDSSSRKRVRIAEAQVVGHVDSLSEQERSDSFWSAEQFLDTKNELKRECRNHRQERRYSDCLTHAYNTAARLAANTNTIEVPNNAKSEQATASLSSPTLDDGLLRWLQDEGPRGLEGYSSRLHAMRRQRHLQDSKHAVFLEQARQILCNQRDDDLLARQAEQASRRARSFATLLGQADAWAATSKEEEEGLGRNDFVHSNDHETETLGRMNSDTAKNDTDDACSK